MSKTILIVDDNELHLRLGQELLQAHGYQVDVANNGVEALTKIRERQPDLVLLDIKMPGISGLDLAQEMRRDPSLAALPVVAVTALARQSDKEACVDAGCNGYMAKPYTMRELLDLVARYLSPQSVEAGVP
jgi:two-component system cell cycle response regulator DivK